MESGAECHGFCHKVRQRLWACQQRAEFCDMYLEADGGNRVPCHKVVVASSSPALYGMMQHRKDSTMRHLENSSPRHTDVSAARPSGRLFAVRAPENSTLRHREFSTAARSKEAVRTRGNSTTVRTMEISAAAVRRLENSATEISTDVEDVENNAMQILRLTEVTPEGLQDLVRLMYLGSVEEIGIEIVELCQRFQFYEPIRLCEENSNKIKGSNSAVTCPSIKSEIEAGEDNDNESVEGKDSSCVVTKNCSNKKSACVSKTRKTCTRARTALTSRTTRKAPRKRTHVAKDSKASSADASRVSAKCLRMLSPKRTRRSSISSKSKSQPLSRSSTSDDAVHTEKVDEGESGRNMIDAGKVKRRQTQVNIATLCRTCDIQFESVELYRAHRDKFHKDYHKCDECAASFKKPKALKAHRVAKHYKEGMPEPTWYYCTEPECTYRSIYRWTLESHYKSKHTNDKLICETCGSRFTTKWALKMHDDRIHVGVQPTVTCGKCDKMFYTPALLGKHVNRVHDKILHFLCDQCPYMGFTKGAVADHQFRQHGVPLPGSKPSFTCPHCDYVSPKKREMEDHIERHTAQTYKCDHCDKVFPASRDMKAHCNLVHSERKAVLHPCPYAGCKYASKYGPMKLQDHISRMHERKDYKPWGCEECGYKSNVKGNLTLHLRNVHGITVPTNRRRLTKVKPGGDTEPPLGGDTEQPPGGQAENQAQIPGNAASGPTLPPSGVHGHQMDQPPPQHTDNLNLMANTCSDTLLLEKGFRWSTGEHVAGGDVQYAYQYMNSPQGSMCIAQEQM